MAKIVLTKDGDVLQEMALSKERITVGRRPHNDIVIDSLAISAEHAVIVTILDDSFLEDLNSTNGTQINGQPVRKHFLQDNDVVELAQYRIRYIAKSHDAGAHGTDPEMSNSCDASAPQTVILDHPNQNQPTLAQKTIIKVLNGASAGREIELTKALTTVGRPGVQVAVITRRPEGYFVTHVEGDSHPCVNGEPIGGGAHLLAYEDVIDLSGTQLVLRRA